MRLATFRCYQTEIDEPVEVLIDAETLATVPCNHGAAMTVRGHDR